MRREGTRRARRLAVVWVGMACTGAWMSWAASEDPLAEFAALGLPGLELWTPLYSVQGAAGYKDNVLFSSFDRQGSALVRGSVDMFLSRAPWDGRGVDLYLFWEHTQFLRDIDVEHEQLGFAQLKLERDLDPGFSAALELDYSYQNQVVDVSVTESDLTIVQVRGHTLKTEPSYRVEFLHDHRLDVGIPVLRQSYESPLDDYLEFGPSLTLRRDYGRDSSWEWEYRFVVRDYDTFTEVTLEGGPLPGTERKFQQHLAKWAWIHYWDEHHRWQSSTDLSYLNNQDGGSGYFDYDRYRLYHRLRYRVESWTCSVVGRISHYDYAYQQVSATDVDTRQRTEYSISARWEREIIDGLSIFGEYDGKWVRGTDRSEEYRVATVLAGLLWEF